MCVLGQPEPVGSVLTFPSGYDTLEYSWVKATAVSVRLQILFVMLQNTNKSLRAEGLRRIQEDDGWKFIPFSGWLELVHTRTYACTKHDRL